jgi:hypothetical protein
VVGAAALDRLEGRLERGISDGLPDRKTRTGRNHGMTLYHPMVTMVAVGSGRRYKETAAANDSRNSPLR